MAEVQHPPQPAHNIEGSDFFHPPSLIRPPAQRTNYGSSIPQESLSWLTATPRSIPLSEIKRRYAEDGYVWVKNVIPRDDVMSFREKYFAHIAPTGILKEGTSPREGIFNPALDPYLHQGLGATPEKSFESFMDSLHSSEEFHTFLAHPTLRAMVRELMDWDREVILKRGLIRHNVPGSRCPSGIHYDQLFLRAGDPVFVSAWVPIGDVTADGGGLMYLEDSCGLGIEVEDKYRKRQESDQMPPAERISAFNHHMGELGHLSHDAEAWSKGEGKGMKWSVGNFEAGDVVFHSPWMIHSSSRNEDISGRIRLSTDLRFYEEGAKLDQRWTRPWFSGDGI